jgi:hypothetical protein
LFRTHHVAEIDPKRQQRAEIIPEPRSNLWREATTPVDDALGLIPANPTPQAQASVETVAPAGVKTHASRQPADYSSLVYSFLLVAHDKGRDCDVVITVCRH